MSAGGGGGGVSTPTATEMRRLVVRDWMNTHGFEPDPRFADQFDGIDPLELERALDRWAQLHDTAPTVADVRDQLRAIRNNQAAGAAIAQCRAVLAASTGWSGREGGTQK